LLDIIAKNAAQKNPTLIRGGLYTLIRSSGVTEAAIAEGGLLGYAVPANKIAKVIGTINVTTFGAQAFVKVNQFDNPSGRMITIGSAVDFTGNLHKTFLFEGEFNSDQDFNIAGSSVGSPATATIIGNIQELPR